MSEHSQPVRARAKKAIFLPTGQTVWVLGNASSGGYHLEVLFPFDQPTRRGHLGHIQPVRSGKIRILRDTSGLDQVKRAA